MLAIRYIVHNLDECAAFYRDHLGFREEPRQAPGSAVLSRDGVRLYLNAIGYGGAGICGGQPEPGGWNRFRMDVDDIESEAARLYSVGARFRGEMVVGRTGRQLLIEDPSGNLIELFEPVRAAAVRAVETAA